MEKLGNMVQLKTYVEITMETFKILENSFRKYMEVNEENATFNDQRTLIILNEIGLELCRLEEIEGKHTRVTLRKDFFEWLIDRYMQLRIIQGKEKEEVIFKYKTVEQERQVSLYYKKDEYPDMPEFYEHEDDSISSPFGLYLL